MPSGGYLERTVRNVEDSDGTLVLHFGSVRGGTERTVAECARLRKPCLPIDGETTAPGQAADRAVAFIAEHDISILNVAGPRASQDARGRAFAYETIARVLARGRARSGSIEPPGPRR